MLVVDGLNVSYGAVQVVHDVHLEVGAGEMVALLGANGAGKTTTLRALSGLADVARGSVLLEGKELLGVPTHRIVREGVAHLPQGRELFAELSVVDNLRLGHWSKRGDSAHFQAQVERVFTLFPKLRERAGQAAGTMSGGEQQMLAVARALMTEPRLLLVDEASMGLAPIVVDQLFDALERVNATGTSILVVEQFVAKALGHTSRAYVLAKGRIVVEGASAELLSSPELLGAYLGDGTAA
ncbi:MAG: branched-chain amino acid transport system ATP-binding protein [Frankiaceae bacterium]|jgi:branched-chain amino acid transport system ATP-binding protein|nr:branched-chain amino acid transport system ATP-binding protein [Frankiaceae bacterium]